MKTEILVVFKDGHFVTEEMEPCHEFGSLEGYHEGIEDEIKFLVSNYEQEEDPARFFDQVASIKVNAALFGNYGRDFKFDMEESRKKYASRGYASSYESIFGYEFYNFFAELEDLRNFLNPEGERARQEEGHYDTPEYEALYDLRIKSLPYPSIR